MKALTLEARLENIPRATSFVDAELEALNCPTKAQMQIDIAIDEVFSNIALYAYAPGTGDVTIRFAFDPETRTAEISFADAGAAYDPLSRADPDVSLSAADREIGGLGIYLVKRTMDGARYAREGGRNVLTIVKRI